MQLPYRNGSNKARKEYCFYSFWDIKHLGNVIDWQGLIYHLPISLSPSSYPPKHRSVLRWRHFSLLVSLLHVAHVQTHISLHADVCTRGHTSLCAPGSLSLCLCHGFIIILLSTRTPVAIYN